MPNDVGSKEDKKGYDKWELENKCNTLMEAEEIKADKKLMKALQPMIDKKMKALESFKSLADIKADAGIED